MPKAFIRRLIIFFSNTSKRPKLSWFLYSYLNPETAQYTMKE